MSDPGKPAQPAAVPADGAFVRSEERLKVSTHRVPAAKAVLRKVIVVERRTIEIDVAHEEVRLECIPYTHAENPDAATPAAHLGLPELVLHEEQVVITKQIVPTERIRVRIDAITKQQQIVTDLRHEQIDVD